MRIRPAVRDERGAAVVWTLALVCVVLTAGALASAVSIQAVVRQRVAIAADLAALAGAQSLHEPCAAAQSAASANDASLVACALEGADVVVTVRRPAPEFVQRVVGAFGGQAADVEVTARAGPA